MNEETFLQSILSFSHLASNSFNIALYEISHGTLNYNSNRIESLLYNPIDQPGLSDLLSNNMNPDPIFLTRIPISRYMVEEDVNDQVSSINDESVFSILHSNARSLLTKSWSTKFCTQKPQKNHSLFLAIRNVDNWFNFRACHRNINSFSSAIEVLSKTEHR